MNGAAHAAVERLIAGGHRRIALVNPARRFSYSQDRIDGFERAFAEAGLAPSPDLVVEGDLSTRTARKVPKRCSSVPIPPTGFVCVNESTRARRAGGVWRAGDCRFGRDVDVIAYDDINVSAYFNPPVTTLYQPIEVLGRRLGQFLLRRIAGEPAGDLREMFRPRAPAPAGR